MKNLIFSRALGYTNKDKNTQKHKMIKVSAIYTSTQT